MNQGLQTKKYDINGLNELYDESDRVDQEIFSEMRSNILLVSGEHYAKRNSKLWSRLRDSKALTDEQKIRLTKNHTQKIVKTYANNIVSYAPGVQISPKNESELQDQKAAELNQAVWVDWKEYVNYQDMVGTWADDFTAVGEIHTKVFFDPNTGPVKEYKAKVDPKTGLDMLDEQGQLIPGDPVFRGGIVCEDIYGFNLLRPKTCKNLKKAAWLGIRKMVDSHEVLNWVKGQPEKQKFVKPDEDKTYVVFDATTGGYGNSQNQILIKEFYFKPCFAYPKGYYYIFTEHGILFEGELPLGEFPIKSEQFERVQTTPRGRGIVKVLRPYQVEINRSSSKLAEHQITLGDDKILIQKGTQLSQGGVLPGIRGVQYSGKEPTILQGRDGSQYLNYLNSQISEMYAVAMVAEDSEEKQAGQMDPYAMLFRSASQKKKFSRYTLRFENFLKQVCKTVLTLAKGYYTEDMLIPAVGRREYVNIAEFKSSDDLCYQIKLEAQTEDLESKFGKLLSINHTLQYVGNKLEKEDIGKLMRAMPYANQEESFSDFTLDYDTATNMVLALDRGQMPQMIKQGSKEYYIKRLNKRMQEADFMMLPPQTQQNYQMVLQQYEGMIAEELAAVQAAQAGYIPTDGYMVTVDLYVSDAQNPYKTKRARIPYSSVVWLIKAIERQGLSQEALAGIDQTSQASIANQLTQGGGGNAIPFPRRGDETPQGDMNGYGTITQPIGNGYGQA